MDVPQRRQREESNEHVYENPAFAEPEVDGKGEQTNVKTNSVPSGRIEPANIVTRYIAEPLEGISMFCSLHASVIKRVVLVLLALGYTAYMIAALVVNFNRAIPLLVIFCLVIFFTVYGVLRDRLGKQIAAALRPAFDIIKRRYVWFKWIFILTILALFLAWIAVDTSKRPKQFISMAGYFTVALLLFLTSKMPGKVRWRPVLWGFGLQFALGLFILRTQAGFEAFNFLGRIVETFLNFVNDGCIFVFGDLYFQHYFAFKVLPTIIFFSSFIAVLQYLGAMQWLILKIAWIMQFSLDTSATESLCAAGNIFIGMTESPLLIRPYMKEITLSEMHAIMVAGFGTVAGSVLGAFLGFGIQPIHLISAAVMAAPCALGVSKLMYPETEVSKAKTKDGLKIASGSERNIVEAAFNGGSYAIAIVLNIAATLIAFIAILAAINAGLSWYGGMLDYPQLSFQLICSYIFMPITFLMGIEWQDCFKCAELLGTMIFLNEFVAYKELGDLIKNRNNGTIPRTLDGTTNWITERSDAIMTYVLCGFANISAVGIMLGGLGAMCPERKGDMSKIVIRALFGGISVNIMSACVAGFLYVPPPPDCAKIFLYDFWNATLLSNVAQCCEAAIESGSIDACRCCEDSSWPTNTYNFTCTGLSVCP